MQTPVQLTLVTGKKSEKSKGQKTQKSKAAA
jgi:hypothetical protein